MVLFENDPHPYYSRNELQCMNLLRHPVWVFDVDTMSMYWANLAALDVWKAASLEELLQRDFKCDMSEADATWLNNFKQNELQQNKSSNERWTLYPKGKTQILNCTMSAIRIPQTCSSNSNSNSSGNSNCCINKSTLALLVEVELSDNQAKITDSTNRSTEILKHLPIAISQFTLDGTKLLYQNPKALQLFGTTCGCSSDCTNKSDPLDKKKTRNADKENQDEDKASPKNNMNSNSGSSGKALLKLFVDAELGKSALLAMQTDEIFSAETQLFVRSSPTPTTTISTTALSVSQRSTAGDVSGSPVAGSTDYDSYTNINYDAPIPNVNSSNNKSPPQQQQRWFQVLLRKARDPITSEFVILYIARDISNIVKARRESVRAALKSEFLDVMAHEIRTPLHQIIGFMDILEADARQQLQKEQLNLIQEIQSSCSLLMTIINDLLDCSKIENGQIQIECINFILPTVVKGCLAAVGPQCHQKGIQLHCTIDPHCSVHVASDPNRLRQILNNLLSNAIKFTATSNGSVFVSVKPVPDDDCRSIENGDDNKNCEEKTNQPRWLRFEVTDDGIGIAPNEMNVVFERYQQANASVARNFGGTGLGLPICKGLVKLLGGNIGMNSEVGKGTTVYFDIPFRITPPTEVAMQCCNGGICNRRHSSGEIASEIESLAIGDDQPIALNVLVVEDNLVNQKVVKAMLHRMGHNVVVAENGKIALTEIHQHQFQVVLMDIQMPVMDGIECTKYIRTVLKYTKEQLPILGLTAGYQHSDRDYYINDVGMNGCLGKPLPMEQLKQAIACYCSND